MFTSPKFVITFCSILLLAFLPTNSAFAISSDINSSEPNNSNGQSHTEPLDLIEASTPGLIETPVVSESIEGFIGYSETSSGQVSIPLHPEDPIEIKSNNQLVQIQYLGSFESNFSQNNGKFLATNNDGADLTAVIGSDSLQLINTVSRAEELLELNYQISVPAGGETIFENGQLFIFDADKNLITFTQIPWAIDSNGTRLRTHFVFQDNVLSQIIDTPAEQISFPIVSDPQFTLYQGWAPSLQMNRSETYSLIGNPVRFCNWFTPISAAQCLLNAASISWNSRLNYEAGGCSWLVYAPGVTFTFRYYGGYCR